MTRTGNIIHLQFIHSLFQKSPIWEAIERSTHEKFCSCVEYFEDPNKCLVLDTYGKLPRQLGAFAGALFALDVMHTAGLELCIDIISRQKGCIALQSLHALLLHAGDKLFKTKNKQLALDLQAELTRRVSEDWVQGDEAAHLIIHVSSTRLSHCYLFTCAQYASTPFRVLQPLLKSTL